MKSCLVTKQCIPEECTITLQHCLCPITKDQLHQNCNIASIISIRLRLRLKRIAIKSYSLTIYLDIRLNTIFYDWYVWKRLLTIDYD